MTKYHKIPGPYRRQETKPHQIIEGAWTSDELDLLQDIEWSFTEKVDGTNIRVIWDGHEVTFGGRTDNAQIPAKLVAVLNDLFKAEGCEELFEQTWGESPAVLYGEGYGAGIQSGGKYAQSQNFVLFDVKVGDWWLRRADVEDVASKFGLEVVPVVAEGPLSDGFRLVRQGLGSQWGDFEAEGLVGRPVVDLFNRKGERVIVKIKRADFR